MNPHLPGARIRSKAWAYQVGLLGEDEHGKPIFWSEKQFDAMDFAAFAAITHPDTPERELELLSEWYIFGWFVDDYLAKLFEMNGDIAGARGYVARILALLPIDLDGPTPAPPETPVERALADLWPRTAPSMSPAWRARYVGHLTTMAQAYLHDIATGRKGREEAFDLVEYIAVRRQVGGVLWSATLVEHSLGEEIPERLYPARPIRSIIDAFADVVSLRNDIISYHIDVSEGRVNNGVMATMNLLGCSIERAVEVVNDLVTSRHHQIEHVAAVELEPFLLERGASPGERASVLRYVVALQDWMAGDLEWELKPGGRYVAAGTGGSPAPGPRSAVAAAARLGLSRSALGLRQRTIAFVPFRTVAPFDRSTLHYPLSEEMNPHIEEVRRASRQWARAVGMLAVAPGASGPLGIWDEASFDGNDAAMSMSMSFLDAPYEQLSLLTDLSVWGFYLNDYLTIVHGYSRDVAGAKALVVRLALFMPEEPGVPVPVPQNPVERGLAALWPRLALGLSDGPRRTARSYILEYIDSTWGELCERIENRIPDPIEYIQARRKSYGGELLGRAIAWAPDSEISPEAAASRPVVELERCMADICCLPNDLASHRKEVEFEGKPSNAVVVVGRLLGCDQAEATRVVVRLLHARIRRIRSILDSELPALMDALDLDEAARDRLSRYGRRMERLACGQLRYNALAGRYEEPQARKMSPLYRVSLRGVTTPGSAISGAAGRVTAQAGQLSPQLDKVAAPAVPVLQGMGTSGLHLATLLRELQRDGSEETSSEAPHTDADRHP